MSLAQTPVDTRNHIHARAQAAESAELTRVLFLAQVPPPVHGVTVTSKNVLGLLRSTDRVAVDHDWAGGARSLADIGKPDTIKFIGFAGLLWRTLCRGLRGARVDVTYQTISPLTASLRDSIVVGVSKLAGRRALVHLHSEGLEVVLHGKGLQRAIERRLLKGAELISIGSQIAREAERSGVFSKAHVLFNYVEDPGTPGSDGLDRTADVLTCGFLANFFTVKGILRFVDVMAALKDKGVPVRGRIAGGETRELGVGDVQAYVDERGLADTVAVQGYIGGDDKAAFMRSLDFFVYPTQQDMAPLVILEAMAYGAVPVAGEAGAIGEMLRPELAAFVLPADDAEALVADTAEVIASFYGAPVKLSEMRRLARRRYEQTFTRDIYARQLANIVRGDAALA